jgi:hypothetical protein
VALPGTQVTSPEDTLPFHAHGHQALAGHLVDDRDRPTDPQPPARHVTRTNFRRLRGNSTSVSTARAAVRKDVALIIQMAAWLGSRGTTIATCTQADIDSWLADGSTSAAGVRPFMRWAARHGHTTAHKIPGHIEDGPRTRTSNKDRWNLVREVLHNDTVPVINRSQAYS